MPSVEQTVTPSGDGIRVVHPLFQAEGDGAIPISPLQLNIAQCVVSLAVRLNELWHSRLPAFTSPPERCLAFAAEYANRYYASAIWSPPLARMLNHTGRYELRRLAIAQDAPKNTASRMLKVMRLHLRRLRPELITLISYQDTGVHSGTIYKASGWLPVVAGDGGEWTRPSRPARLAQTATPKVRWEITA